VGFLKTGLFVITVLVSGSFAGLIYGGLNLVIVEPFLDDATNIENQNLFASGEESDTTEFWVEYNSYRSWQKGGQILASTILGASLGSLFGIVFAYSRKSLPSDNNIRKTIVLAGIMWFVLFVIPFLKYPANPPTVGETETVMLRGILYLSFIAISGFSALGFYQLHKRLEANKKIIAIIGYGIFITSVFFLMPDNPDKITVSTELVDGFRIFTFFTTSIFWLSLALILGAFWQKLSLDVSTN
tara:strand:- start:1063 stop:1791 length:729 start_codon:yes stop_codon:yes gene_type:complete